MKVNYNSSKQILLKEIEELRYSLKQYQTLLGVCPFKKEDLKGDPGPPGNDGVIQSIVAGENITIDNTDPLNPIVNSTGGGGTTGDFMTLDSKNEVINNWSISNSGNFNITPKSLSLADYGNTYNTITLSTINQFPGLNIEDNYRGSSVLISSRPEYLFYYQNNNESKYATFSTKSIFLQDGSDSLELTTQYFGVRTSNLFANINFPLMGNYNYNLPLVNEDNEPEFNHTLVASVNGQFADEYGNIEIEGGTGGDLTLEQARQNGNVLEGSISFEGEHQAIEFKYGDGVIYAETVEGVNQLNIGCDNSSISFKHDEIKVNINSDTSFNHKGIVGLSEFNKQGDRKAFAQLSDVYDANSYSTTETKTGGTWIDGKPIYRRVFEVFGGGDLVTLDRIDLSPDNVESVVLIGGNCTDGSENFPVNYTRVYGESEINSSSVFHTRDGENSLCYVYSSIVGGVSNGVNLNYTIILEYTKTTD